MAKIDDKIVFALSPEGQGDGVPVVILGIPKAAWDYMADGKTHTFDLTKVGCPVKLVLFGAEDHAAVMKAMNEAMSAANMPYLDERQTDFSIKPRKGDA